MNKRYILMLLLLIDCLVGTAGDKGKGSRCRDGRDSALCADSHE